MPVVVAPRPGAVFEVDQVDGAEAREDEGEVVVDDDGGGEGDIGGLGSRGAFLQRNAGEPGGDVAGDFELEAPVAHHVEDDGGDERHLDTVADELGGHASAAVKAVVVAVRVAEAFLAVEEGEAHGVTEPGLAFGEMLREGEQDAGARAAVVGALEPLADAGLRVVVRAEEDDGRRIAGDVDVDVAEGLRGEGGVFRPGVGAGFEAHAADLLGEPLRGLGGAQRAGVARNDLDEFARVGEHPDPGFGGEAIPARGAGFDLGPAADEPGEGNAGRDGGEDGLAPAHGSHYTPTPARKKGGNRAIGNQTLPARTRAKPLSRAIATARCTVAGGVGGSVNPPIGR